MLHQLSEMERQTLIQFGNRGSGGNYDALALNKLFTLDLIEIDDDRRVVLTAAGRATFQELTGTQERKPTLGKNGSPMTAKWRENPI
jgi:hypothetical protein